MSKPVEKGKPRSADASDLASFFTADDLICGTRARDRDGVLRELLDRLAGNHPEIADPEEAMRLVIEREEAHSTVVADGIAMPHARIDGIPRPCVAIGTSREGIAFDASSPSPVHVVALVLTPRSQPAIYLQIVKALASAMRDADAIRNIVSFTDPDELRRFILRGELRLPDYVCAADVMRPPKVVLRENDSLKTAIDRFVKGDITQIPVTDKDGDLVGVVSADALLHVCLPEYMLWMDDLTPIQNFEPFALVLHNERNSWLKDILVAENFASVQLDAPAISIAAEFTRKNADTCYVLDGQKLAGEVTLQQFLAKIFRD